jgi:hypothetical protein
MRRRSISAIPSAFPSIFAWWVQGPAKRRGGRGGSEEPLRSACRRHRVSDANQEQRTVAGLVFGVIAGETHRLVGNIPSNRSTIKQAACRLRQSSREAWRRPGCVIALLQTRVGSLAGPPGTAHLQQLLRSGTHRKIRPGRLRNPASRRQKPKLRPICRKQPGNGPPYLVGMCFYVSPLAVIKELHDVLTRAQSSRT